MHEPQIVMEGIPINPSDFGLNSRVELIQISKDNIGIVKRRKSRIIMKDGIIISRIITQIKSKLPKTKISLVISGPICSKTISYLENYNVRIIREN